MTSAGSAAIDVSRAARSRERTAAMTAATFGSTGPRRSFRPDFGSEVCTLIDPRSQHADLFIRQRAGWRHLQSAIAMHEPLDEFAVRAVARRDDRPVVPTAQRGLPQVEAQTRLLGLGAVTGVTVLREDWPHIGVVVDGAGGRRRQRVLRRTPERHGDRAHEERGTHSFLIRPPAGRVLNLS